MSSCQAGQGVRNMGKTLNRCRVSLVCEENILKVDSEMVVQLCGCTKKPLNYVLLRLNFMIRELNINKTIVFFY